MPAPLSPLAVALQPVPTATSSAASVNADAGGQGSFRSALERGMTREHGPKPGHADARPASERAASSSTVPAHGKPEAERSAAADVPRDVRGIDLARLITDAVGAVANGLKRDAGNANATRDEPELAVDDSTSLAPLALPIQTAVPVPAADAAPEAADVPVSLASATDTEVAVPVEVEIVAADAGPPADSGAENDTPAFVLPGDAGTDAETDSTALPRATVATAARAEPVVPGTPRTAAAESARGTPAAPAATAASGAVDSRPGQPPRATVAPPPAQMAHAAPQANARAEAVAAAPSAVAMRDTSPPEVFDTAVPLAASTVAAHVATSHAAATVLPHAAMQGRIDAPLNTPAWGQSLGQQISWMLNGAHQTAELHLHPVDLGPVQVVLSVENKTADLRFIAHEPAVREALQQELPRLRDMLAQNGIQLGQANVSAEQQPRDNPAQAQAAWNRNESERGAEPALAATHRPITTNRGLIDTFA